MSSLLALNVGAWATDLGAALALAAAFFALVLATASKMPRIPEEAPLGALGKAVSRIVHGLPGRSAEVGLGIYVLAAITLGVIAVAFEIPEKALRLNEEHSIPTYAGTLLFYAAGLVALTVGERAETNGRWWRMLGAIIIAFGVSEAAELHERVELRTGLPSLVVIAPLGAMAAYALFRLLPDLKRLPPSLSFMAAGVLAWMSSQAIDPIHQKWKSVIEESLEMIGTACVLLALLVVFRDMLSRNLPREVSHRGIANASVVDPTPAKTERP